MHALFSVVLYYEYNVNIIISSSNVCIIIINVGWLEGLHLLENLENIIQPWLTHGVWGTTLGCFTESQCLIRSASKKWSSMAGGLISLVH